VTQVAVSMARPYLCAGHAVAGILSPLDLPATFLSPPQWLESAGQ